MQIKNANIVLTKISQQLKNQLLNLFSINFQRYFIDFSFFNPLNATSLYFINL